MFQGRILRILRPLSVRQSVLQPPAEHLNIFANAWVFFAELRDAFYAVHDRRVVAVAELAADLR